jgi:hypothetical protein
MVQPYESNTLELCIAFHNAVARFKDWTTDVAEPRVRFRGRFCPLSEVCEEVGHLFDPLPKGILPILCKGHMATRRAARVSNAATDSDFSLYALL